jgi:membrane protease YdiL (CAAX protease family)
LIGGLGYALKTPDIQMPIKDLMTDAKSIALVGVFATTFGPAFEELAFRGFLLPLAARSMGPWPAIVATALPFSALHGPQYAWSWRHLLLLTLASVAFGWVRYRSASTAAAACTHAGYNLTFLIAYLAQRDSGV